MDTQPTLIEAAASGDQQAALRALRDIIATEIQTAESARDVAALSRQLTDVLNQIAGVPATSAGTGLDELKKRRADRQAKG